MKEFPKETPEIEDSDENFSQTSDEEEMQSEEEIYEEEIFGDIFIQENIPKAASKILQTELKLQLKAWYIKHNPSRECVEDLLKILKSEKIDVPNSLEGLIGIRKTSPERNGHVERNEISLKQILKTLERIETTQRTMNKKLCKLQSVVDTLVSKNEPITRNNVFPINTIEELEYAESLISEDISKYIQILKLIIQPEGLCKNFCRIFSDSMILKINYDGVGNKIAFTKYKHLKEALMESTAAEGRSEKDFMKDIRKCFGVHKNRIFKKNYDDRNRKKNEREESVH